MKKVILIHIHVFYIYQIGMVSEMANQTMALQHMTSDIMENFGITSQSNQQSISRSRKGTMFSDPVIQIPDQKLYKRNPNFLLKWLYLIDKVEDLQGSQFPGWGVVYDYDPIEGSVGIMLVNCFIGTRLFETDVDSKVTLHSYSV